MPTDKTILLVEDNPQSDMFTLRALRRVSVANTVVWRATASRTCPGWPQINH
jgi:hypothetical protein